MLAGVVEVVLAAAVVGITVALMAASAFFVVKRAMYADVDNRLHQQVDSVAPAMSSPVTQFTTVMMMLMFRPALKSPSLGQRTSNRPKSIRPPGSR